MKKKKIGLALGGGGAKGLAHIGVIQALLEENFEIVEIAGVSMGAIIGAGYAYSKDINRLKHVAINGWYKQHLRSQNRRVLMNVEKIVEFFDEFLDHKSFDDLQIDLKICTTDFIEMKRFVIDSGRLSTAIAASCAAPFIHSPIHYQGKLLVDGGIVCTTPVDLFESKKLDLIVAVDFRNDNIPKYLQHELSPLQKKLIGFHPVFALCFKKQLYSSILHLKNILENETEILREKNVSTPILRIKPDTKNISMVDFEKAEKIIEIGYKSTKTKLAQLKK